MKNIAISVIAFCAAVLMVTVDSSAQSLRVVTATSCSHADINALRAALEIAFNARDPSKLAALYTPNASLLTSEPKPIASANRIAAYYKQLFAAGAAKLRLEPIACDVSGQLGYEVGNTSTESKVSNQSGHYLIVFRRTTAGWRIEQHSVSVGQPRPAKP
jgi:ketosteroid isomerase-like protein